MLSLVEAPSPAARAYDAAAADYDHPALSFWDRFGRRTVERLPLRPGMSVLDVCCGMGASAIPAAERVRPTGRVTAVDLAAGMLRRGRERARTRGLDNLQFRQGDLQRLPFPDASFDAVVCVFGLFFASDMAAAAAELWRVVRPGGWLAVTTWGPDVFEPANTCFWDAVRAERPDLYRAFSPWDRISRAEGLHGVLRAGGVVLPDVVAEPGEHPLLRVQDWWAVVMGSGYRGTVELMSPAEQSRVRARTLQALADTGAEFVRADVLYARARKSD